MRRIAVMLVIPAVLAGCEDPPEWWRRHWEKSEPPLSLPKTGGPTTWPAVEPTSRPAAPTTAPAPAVTPAAAPAAAPRTTGGAVMAYVNDQPIYMAELNRLLICGYGMAVAQQLIANELVRQQAGRQNVTVSEADLEAEHDQTLRSMFGTVDDPNQRERLLEQLLTRNRVSQEQWRLTMRRNALLGKLAEKQLTVTEDDLKEEFGRQHERKVEVQHIQTASLADAQEVLRKLASGEAFAAMVAKHSIGPSARDGGMLAPFGAKDTGTPPAIREAALAMKKVGEVSDPIQIGTAFHLIKLVRTIEPKDVKFEDVKGALLAAVRARKTKSLQQDLLQILIRGARVQYVSPILKSQADKGSQP